MINVLGPYILVIFTSYSGGIATTQMESFEACQAAVTQLEVTGLHAVCIAATLEKPDD